MYCYDSSITTLLTPAKQNTTRLGVQEKATTTMIAIVLLIGFGQTLNGFWLWWKIIEDGKGFKHRYGFVGVLTTSVTLSRNQLGLRNNETMSSTTVPVIVLLTVVSIFTVQSVSYPLCCDAVHYLLWTDGLYNVPVYCSTTLVIPNLQPISIFNHKRCF